MATNKIGDVRPSQLITTFGPGAIIDAKKDCVTILDINYWDKNGKEIKDSRFASYMGVDYFKEPPTASNRHNSEDLPVVSFPDYHICSNVKCSNIFKLSLKFDVEKYKKFGSKCPKCNYNAYPSRFIQICPNGHMEDFDYNRWVHKDVSCDGDLKLISTGNTSSLGDLMVTCTKCNAKRSLAGLTSPENNCSCHGHHPFRPALSGDRCRAQMKIVQRGASNVYFPVIKSAISIPPYTDRIYMLIDEHKRDLENFRQVKRANPSVPIDPEDIIYQTYFKDEFSRDDFDKALRNSENGTRDYLSIKKSEYLAIINHNNPVNMRSPHVFKAEENEIPDILKPYFSRVIRITRLREIMCLKGFTRLDAPDPEAEEQVNIVKLNTSKKWLPGVEVNGEGIFIEFNKNSINDWLSKTDVKKIDDKFKKAFRKYSENRGWSIVYERGAVYALMHTFSHLLIKVMGNKSGYSTSSIKERIYAGDDMAGILLYTGSSDKEGSLGGLVELGKYEKLMPLIQTAFEESLLCTNDPECMLNELDENLNISACHSCCMISETACENGNRMLDRGLIVPINEDCDKSFFTDLVKEMCDIE